MNLEFIAEENSLRIALLVCGVNMLLIDVEKDYFLANLPGNLMEVSVVEVDVL